jgi:hypothetical protein
MLRDPLSYFVFQCIEIGAREAFDQMQLLGCGNPFLGYAQFGGEEVGLERVNFIVSEREEPHSAMPRARFSKSGCWWFEDYWESRTAA